MRTRWFAVGALLAMGCRFPAPVPNETKLSGPRVDVPLHLKDGDVVVSARINGKGPYEFGIDTGSTLTVISSRMVDELGVQKRRFYGTLSGIAESRFRRLYAAHIDELDLGGVIYRDFEALVLDIPGLDGLLGFGHFSGNLVTLDFPNKNMILRPGRLFLSDGAQPYRVSHLRPVIPVRLGERELSCLIDTGHDGYLVVDRRRGDVAFEAAPVEFRMRGIQGARSVKAGRSPETLRIEGHAVPRPIVALGFEDNLGLEILRHFAITFDQEHRLVRFDRTRGTPIVIPPKMGFAFTAGRDGVIRHVVRGSRAEAAGLSVGDRVVSRTGSIVVGGDPRPMTLGVRRAGVDATLKITVPWEPVIR